MPLARILTHHPERATALSEQLQQQGYQVEVCRPDQPNLAGADLEIEFEICERADALDRAASLADELHADVAVAPGVLKVEAPPEVREAAVPPAGGQVSDREREFEAAFQSIGTEAEREPAAELPAKEQPQVIDFPVMEQSPLHPIKLEASVPGTPEPLPPVQFLDETAEPLQTHAAGTPRPPDPVPYLAQLTPFGTPDEGSTYRFGGREPERHTPQVTEITPAEAGWSKRVADFVGKSMAAMKVGVAETAESFRENLKEYKKRAQVRSAEAHAKRVARMLDLEQRQAEAQERAKELEIAREAAASRLADLLRERDPGVREEGLRQEQLREEMLHEARKPSPPVVHTEDSPLRKPAEALRQVSILGLMKKPARPMSPQLRAVMTGAAAVTFLFVIGIVLGVLQPHSQQASTENKPASSSGAAAPSAGVTVQTGGVTVKTGTAGQAAAKPSQSPATAAVTTQGAAPGKPSPRLSTARHIAEENGEAEIGDDVVVRHYKTPAPTQKPKQNGQQAGLKHFSDLDSQ